MAKEKGELENVINVLDGLSTQLEDAKAMIDAGATRLGVSAGVAIMEGLTSNDSY